MEEAGVLDLVRRADDVAGLVFGLEAQHQRMRKRPGLAREVAHVAHAQRHFLGDLAVDRLLGRFAGVHEARQRAVEAGREVVGTAEQDLVAALHRDDHHRRHARIVLAAAGGIGAAPHLGVARLHRRRTAGAAELVRAVPFEQFQRARGEAAEVVGQDVVEALQVGEAGARRRFGVGRQFRRLAGQAGARPGVGRHAQRLGAQRQAAERAERVARRQRAGVGEQQFGAAKRQPAQRLRQCAGGGILPHSRFIHNVLPPPPRVRLRYCHTDRLPRCAPPAARRRCGRAVAPPRWRHR